jgi:hypothetical protein
MKYVLNTINTILFTQQMKWFVGKGVELVVNNGILIEYSICT